MKRTYLMLLWHMHQPYYKDLVKGVYTMPWVRLHALKDYYGMVALLRDFPTVRVTFNFVPSLLAQLEEYAQDRAREPAFEIAFKPAIDLSQEEKAALLRFGFQLNRNLLNRYPRFRELEEKVRCAGADAERYLGTQDYLDLQVLSQLAWFDEIYLENDYKIRGLVEKERGYTEEDKSLLRSKELELFNKVLEELRAASGRGQIEISTSPFYHPILPLLCDSNIALEAHPGITLPRRRFQRPEDARGQLQAAVALHTRLFGSRPRGLWPSEGSVSDQVLRLAAEEGFAWAATDEGVLGRSLNVSFYRQADGTVSAGRELYRPHRLVGGEREITIFFRDHQLSDLIGFVYSHMDAQAAAADLHQRIRAAGRSTGDRPAVVSVILDGENAWEFFPRNGREFLKSFYGRIAADPEVAAVTASEALEVTEPGTLQHVVPGSWINANFDVWIGASEDNRAWDLLTDARDFFATAAARPDADPAQVELARQELWIAEGSDWCWWYGPEHSSALDEEFDQLFRKHLSNIYRLLDSSPPDELAVPIKRPKVHAVNVPPTARITPRVDGEVSNYFEWLGAGVYTPDYRSGSMHGRTQFIDALYYGYCEKALYLRLDLSPTFLKLHPEFEIRVNVDGASRVRVQAQVSPTGLGMIQFWKQDEQLLVPLATGDQLQAAFVSIFELRVDYALLGLHPQEKVSLQVALWADQLPLAVIPQEGWLTLELTDELVSW
jgi:alpha-amylase/alpha-mannosidase (GH57 family)